MRREKPEFGSRKRRRKSVCVCVCGEGRWGGGAAGIIPGEFIRQIVLDRLGSYYDGGIDSQREK